MAKPVIFTKIVDYNNKLEKILEKKAFSEEVKNLLLSMLYKVETAYHDYRTVKRNAMAKEQYVQEILNTIEYNCNEIEFVKPLSEESKILKGKRFLADKEKGKIICYQNEISVLQALLDLAQDEIELSSKYNFFAPLIIEFLQNSFLTDHTEMIRDFNGFSWDILVRDIENLYENILYQNALILLGNRFIENWINKNNNPENFEEEKEEEIFIPINNILSNKNFENIYDENNNIDYIERMHKIMTEIYGEKLSKDIEYRAICAIIAIGINKQENEKQKILNVQKEYETKLLLMENKIQYTLEKTNEKKAILKRIGRIDELLNNNSLLKNEYIEQNSRLPNAQKIFSISHFADRLEKERKNCIKQIQDINYSIEPEGFVNLKTQIESKVKFFKNIQINEEGETQVDRLFIPLQKAFLYCFREKVKKAETKKEIIEYIYEFRYYLRLPIGKKEQYMWIFEKKELTKIIQNIEKLILKKAIQLKAINNFSEDEKLNYNILKNIFTSKIITLEKMNILLRYEKQILYIEIYDENIHEITVENKIKEKTELNVKLKKKIKVFN